MAETDPSILRVREAFEKSGLTLDELGTRMGYKPAMARKSAWQFLNKTSDPRLSMLRRFASAVGIMLESLFVDPVPATKPKKSKK
jgi:transcriptional regulator with XRE-family HTH domain